MQLSQLTIAVCTIILSGGVFSEQNIEETLGLITLPPSLSISLLSSTKKCSPAADNPGAAR